MEPPLYGQTASTTTPGEKDKGETVRWKRKKEKEIKDLTFF